MSRAKKTVPSSEPKSLDDFFSLKVSAEMLGIPSETLDYFARMNSIPYKLQDGKKFFRNGSLIRFKNGWEQIPIEGTGERFSKDWRE